MSDKEYVLELTTFGAGINIYTGTVQGGHTYAQIRDDNYKTVVELERIIDEEFLETIPEGDVPTYRIGRMTSRLLTEAEAIYLACEWMKDNEPNRLLVSNRYQLTAGEGGVIYYNPHTAL